MLTIVMLHELCIAIGIFRLKPILIVIKLNTDLLEKAKLEKQITALESERQALNRSKSSARFRLEEIQQSINSNQETISRMQRDWNLLNTKVQRDDSENILNPVRLDGVKGSDPKIIGKKLNEINESARASEEYRKIGTLYGFNHLVKIEASMKNGFNFEENRFFVEGESGIKYAYNNSHIAKNPKLASTSFLKALERISILIDNHERLVEKATWDIPVLEEVVNSQWRKEDELRKLKSDLAALDREIQMTIGDNSVNANIQYNQAISQDFRFETEKKVFDGTELKAQFRIPYSSHTFNI